MSDEAPAEEEVNADLDDEKKCSVTGFTQKEKAMIQQSWRKIIGTTPKEFKNAGINLLLWMFENVPNMRERFSKFNANTTKTVLIADEMFLAHTQSVILALDTLVKLLDQPESLAKKARNISVAHVSMSPPVGMKYFKPFHDKFNTFIRTSLGVPAEDRIVNLWCGFLGYLCTMIEEEEGKMKSQKSGGTCCVLS